MFNGSIINKISYNLPVNESIKPEIQTATSVESQILEKDQMISQLIHHLETNLSERNILFSKDIFSEIRLQLMDKISKSFFKLEDIQSLSKEIAELHKHRLIVETDEIVETVSMANLILEHPKVETEKLTMDEISSMDQEVKKAKKKFEKIISKTVFWRCSLKDLNPNLPDEPADLTLGIINGEFHLFVSAANLRPIPFTKVQTGLAIAALGLGALASYPLFGEGIVTKALVSGFAGFMTPVLGQVPYVPRILGPASLMAGAYYLDQCVGGNYLKLSMLAVSIGAVLYKKFGKTAATGARSGEVDGLITKDWPTMTEAKKMFQWKKHEDKNTESTVATQSLLESSKDIEKGQTEKKINQAIPLTSINLKQLPNLPFQIMEDIKLNLDYKGSQINYGKL